MCSGGGIDTKTLRIPGVLQRLALTYFLVAMIEVCFAKRYDEQLVSDVVGGAHVVVCQLTLLWDKRILARMLADRSL